MDAADLRQVNVAGAIDSDIGVEIHLAPYADPDLVAGTNHVIGRHRNLVNRSKRRWNASETDPGQR